MDDRQKDYRELAVLDSDRYSSGGYVFYQRTSCHFLAVPFLFGSSGLRIFAMAKANANHMIQRIIITGTESTGKTELAAKLAEHYKTVFVPDYSRQYIGKLDRK